MTTNNNAAQEESTIDTSGRLSHTPDAIVGQLLATARGHIERKRFDRAHEVTLLLTQMRPDSDAMWVLRGTMARELKRIGEALESLTRAVQLAPDSRVAQLELGELLCLVGRPIEGLNLVRIAFEAGHDRSLPPAKQDPLTIRAGMILEGVQRGVEEIQKLQPDQAKPN